MNEDERIINWMNEGTEIAKGNGLSEDFMVWMLMSAFLIKARTFSKEEKEETEGGKMGYRLNIGDLGNYDLCFYGTKLYGYVKEAELPSCQYLISIGKAEKDDIWGYGFTHEMTLTAGQFREFMALYEKDFDEVSGFGPLSDYHDYDVIQTMLKTESDKHLIWD